MNNGPIHSHEFPKWLVVKERLSSLIVTGAFGAEGESFPTVRSLAEQHGVSLVTAQKVVTILRDQGFIRTEGKRYVITALAGGAQKQLGFLATMPDNPFFAALARHITDSAAERGCEVLCAYSSYDIKREKQLLDMFRREKVAGILACPADIHLSEPNFSTCATPLVFLGRKPMGSGADAVLPQNFSAGQAVARHLHNCGARSFAYVGLQDYDCDPRLQGFRAGLTECGVKLPDKALSFADKLDWDPAIRELVRIVSGLPHPTAVFCFHDLLAARAMRELSAQGLQIPGEILVAGFDDLPLAAELTPALTSVSYPLKQMAELAIDRILKRIHGDLSPPCVHSLDPRLVIRASTGGAGAEAYAPAVAYGGGFKFQARQ